MQQKQKILIVDDNAANLSVVADYLEEFDFLIMTARNGEKGIEQARRGRPDIILLDVMMPKVNGFEVCQRLKHDDITKDIPVLFMTALTDIKDQLKGFAVGGVDYITKPVQREVVLARVRTHLRLRAQQQKLQQQAIELEQAWHMAEEARAGAERANQAKSTFLANMSHELRTPLNAILGFARIMARDPHTDEEQENLVIIQHSGEHLLTLINQVLDLSKIEAGRITLNEKKFDLHRLLDDLKGMFSLRAQTNGLQLVFERAEDVPRWIHTDEVKLRQVLINLLNNAIKFTKEGEIQLSVSSYQLSVNRKRLSVQLEEMMTDHCLLFTVKDTGPGIAPEEMDKLFEAFAQTETGRQAKEGTGLGLTISRKFVQLMGGEITVKSTGGMGTTFSFDIQAGIVDAQDIEETQSPQRPIALEPGQPHYRLLIVEDKPDNRTLLVKLLNPFGFELREATNGQEAIEIWEVWEPHLIWMDLRMPVLDGYKATQQIKMTPRGKQTVVILLSASVVDEEQMIVTATGCDAFLQKPFRESQIFDLLHKQLGLRFVYEEEKTPTVKDDGQRAEEVLTPDALAALPTDVATELRQAVEDLNTSRTNRSIDRIRQQNEALADALVELVRGYRFDIVQEVFEKIGR